MNLVQWIRRNTQLLGYRNFEREPTRPYERRSVCVNSSGKATQRKQEFRFYPDTDVFITRRYYHGHPTLSVSHPLRRSLNCCNHNYKLFLRSFPGIRILISFSFYSYPDVQFDQQSPSWLCAMVQHCCVVHRVEARIRKRVILRRDVVLILEMYTILV